MHTSMTRNRKAAPRCMIFGETRRRPHHVDDAPLETVPRSGGASAILDAILPVCAAGATANHDARSPSRLFDLTFSDRALVAFADAFDPI